MCKEACPDLELKTRYVIDGYTMYHAFAQGAHFREGVCWCGRYERHGLHVPEMAA